MLCVCLISPITSYCQRTFQHSKCWVLSDQKKKRYQDKEFENLLSRGSSNRVECHQQVSTESKSHRKLCNWTSLEIKTGCQICQSGPQRTATKKRQKHQTFTTKGIEVTWNATACLSWICGRSECIAISFEIFMLLPACRGGVSHLLVTSNEQQSRCCALHVFLFFPHNLSVSRPAINIYLHASGCFAIFPPPPICILICLEIENIELSVPISRQIKNKK